MREKNTPDSTLKMGYRNVAPSVTVAPLSNKIHTDTTDIFILQVDVMKNAQGSAFLTVGGTKVTCAVFGPLFIPNKKSLSATDGNLEIYVNSLPFSLKDNRTDYKPTVDDENVAEKIRESFRDVIKLDRYPRNTVRIEVTILENSGSLVSTCVNCTSAALMSAAIEMNDIPVAVDTAIHQGENELSLKNQPSTIDEESAGGVLTLTSLLGRNEISFVDLVVKDEQLELKEVVKVMQSSLNECSVVHARIKSFFY